MQEKNVPIDKVESLGEVLAGDEESETTFEVIENLVSVAVQSIVDEKKALAEEAVSGVIGTPVEIITMTTDEEIFAYLAFKRVQEEAYLHVGTYPNMSHHIESYPSDEKTVLERLAKRARKLPK